MMYLCITGFGEPGVWDSDRPKSATEEFIPDTVSPKCGGSIAKLASGSAECVGCIVVFTDWWFVCACCVIGGAPSLPANIEVVPWPEVFSMLWCCITGAIVLVTCLSSAGIAKAAVDR